ncbi:MAG: hypothetical protein COA94_03015 [Rickettsiales bacterium]|nr:MAG: hypothetical protein COA94_03015 [Rickettsiales bacterium]
MPIGRTNSRIASDFILSGIVVKKELSDNITQTLQGGLALKSYAAIWENFNHEQVGNIVEAFVNHGGKEVWNLMPALLTPNSTQEQIGVIFSPKYQSLEFIRICAVVATILPPSPLKSYALQQAQIILARDHSAFEEFEALSNQVALLGASKEMAHVIFQFVVGDVGIRDEVHELIDLELEQLQPAGVVIEEVAE